MKLEFKIDKGDIADSLRKFSGKLKNNNDLLTEVGEILVEDIKQRIITSKKDTDEKPWKPWAKSTRQARERAGTAALGLLFNSGNLAHSIDYRITDKNKLKVGTNVKYAEYLDEGTDKMPARPFMGISKRAQKGINEALKIYLSEKK